MEKKEKEKALKIIFMGTPEFAVPALNALIKAGHDIPLVFTQPDKPAGRGHKMQCSPVKLCARENNIEVFQPLSLRKGQDADLSLERICEINPDVIIVAAYGQILPKAVLETPRLGCVNVHASLLPRWRGASPVNHAIMAGDTESGVTIMQMETGIDTGGMFLWERCEITPLMTAFELHDILKETGAKLIVRFTENPEFFIARIMPQNDSLATYAPVITKEMKQIDRNKPAHDVYNFIRGMSGQAYLYLNGKRFKVFKSEIADEKQTELDILCGDGKVLRLLKVQLEGRDKVSAGEFLRGYKESFIWSNLSKQ